MAKIINGSTIYLALADYLATNAYINDTAKDVLVMVAMWIDEAPTVDAVEVVRCKDCKHRGEEGECPMYWVKEIEWDDDGYTECDYVPHDYTVDDGFCDRGERKDNGC